MRLANYFPVSGIINRLLGLVGGVGLKALADLALRPDLVDLKTKEVWEIKRQRNLDVGRAELWLYIGLLNLNTKVSDGEAVWHPGTDYRPASPQRGFLRSVNVWAEEPGIILYTDMEFSRGDMVMGLAGVSVIVSNVIAAEFASLEVHLGNAIMLNTMAPVP